KLALDTGIVEEAVDPAVGLDRSLHVGLHVLGFDDVSRHHNSFPAVLADDADGRLRPGAVAVHHHHLRALTRERHRRGAADAIAAAGAQRTLAGEIHSVGLVLSLIQSRLTPLALTGPLHFLISLVTNCVK